MNKAIIAGVAAGVLVVAFVFSPLFNAFSLQGVHAQNQGAAVTRHYTLVPDEKEAQVAPDNALHPGGIMYNAMIFNGTIPGPVVTANVGEMIEFTLVNEEDVIHSIDFHAGIGPS